MRQIIFYFIDVWEYNTHLHLSQENTVLLLVINEKFIQVLTTTIHFYFEILTSESQIVV